MNWQQFLHKKEKLLSLGVLGRSALFSSSGRFLLCEQKLLPIDVLGISALFSWSNCSLPSELSPIKLFRFNKNSSSSQFPKVHVFTNYNDIETLNVNNHYIKFKL